MRTALSILAFLLFSASSTAQEQADSDLLLILDASNSMWGQIDGVNKIVIARDAVGGLIDALPDEQEVGLIAYGHRREGDCDDIEVLQDIYPVDKPGLQATINAINPKGRTPITASINAALDLAKTRESTSIVLISDGLETCGKDPCSAVRTAKASGVPFVLHVVGFDVAGEDTSQLECAAQEGDGVYLSAENATQLSDALKSAYEKPEVPDGRLVVSATAEGALQDAVVLVRNSETGKQVGGGRTYSSSDTNPRRVPLEDGRYKASVTAVRIKGSPTFSFEFEIADGNQVEKSFDFSAGEVSVLVTRNGELADAVVTLQSVAEDSSSIGGRTYNRDTHNPMVQRVSAGTYDISIKSVEMRYAPKHEISGIEVKGSERTELNYDFTSGDLLVGTRRGDTLVDSVVSVSDESGTYYGGGRTYTNDKSNPKRIILPPGNYKISVTEVRGEKRTSSATVTAGEATEVMIDLEQAEPE